MDKKGLTLFLEEKLVFLVDNEKTKEIKKYTDVIDSYVKLGQSEVDAVASLGDLDDLVLAIYLSHGLDYKKLMSGKISGKGFIGALKNFFRILSSPDKKNARDAILYLIYLILIVVLMKVVFILLRDISFNIFNEIFSGNLFDKVYYILFEVVYIFSALLVFISSFIKRFS